MTCMVNMRYIYKIKLLFNKTKNHFNYNNFSILILIVINNNVF